MRFIAAAVAVASTQMLSSDEDNVFLASQNVMDSFDYGARQLSDFCDVREACEVPPPGQTKAECM